MPRSFDELVLPHLDAAFNYARWLAKNETDAEDVVQDAYVRALRFFSSAARRGCACQAPDDCPQHMVRSVSATCRRDRDDRRR
jgi:hypothetical protein